MDGIGHGFPVGEFLSHGAQYQFAHTIGYEKFLEVQWIHVLDFDAAQRDGRSCLQGIAQKRTAANIGEFVVFSQEFEQGKQVVVGLYLVDKDQGVLFFPHLFTSHGTQGKVEIIHSLSVGKILLSHLVGLHIELDKVRE